MKKGLLLFLSLVFLVGCGTDQGPVSEDFDHYLYEVVDSKGNVDYLLGAFHTRNGKIYSVSQMLEEAFMSSDALVIEASPMAVDLQMGKDDSYATKNKASDLSEKEILDAFAAIPEYKKFDPNLYNAMTLYSLVCVSNGYEMPFVALGSTGINGIDRFLAETAIKMKKPVIELEGANRQIEMMIELSEIAPNYLIERTLDTKWIQETGKKMKDAYYAYHQETLFKLLSTYESSRYQNEAKKVKEYLIDKRNEDLYLKIRNYVLDDKQQFIVMSLAQLYGENGIIQQLENEGYEVRSKIKK